MWTIDQAIANWHYCFTSGYLTAAKAWWALVEELRQADADSIPAHIARATYPIVGRFAKEAEAHGATPEVLTLAARMADDLIAALA